MTSRTLILTEWRVISRPNTTTQSRICGVGVKLPAFSISARDEESDQLHVPATLTSDKRTCGESRRRCERQSRTTGGVTDASALGAKVSVINLVLC